MIISILELEELVKACKMLKKDGNRYGDSGFSEICMKLDNEADFLTGEMLETLSRIIISENGQEQDVTVPSLAKTIRSTLGWEVNTDEYEYIKGTAHVADAVRGELEGMGHYSCIDIVRGSNAVDDYYLYNVLARNDSDGSYAVWTYNDSLKSLQCGRYDLGLREALKTFWDVSWY